MSARKKFHIRTELGTMVANVFFDVFFVPLVTAKRQIYEYFTT